MARIEGDVGSGFLKLGLKAWAESLRELPQVFSGFPLIVFGGPLSQRTSSFEGGHQCFK
jgi:hypothetical protein